MAVRHFIVGTGEGLDVEFLGEIRDEVSFSCNSIGAIYDKTEWRPTYYVLSSENFTNPSRQGDFLKSFAGTVYANRDFYATIPQTDVRWFDGRPFPDTANWSPDWWSDNPEEWMSRYGTSLLPCAQLSFHMKPDEVYFLGCDGYAVGHVEGYPEWAEDFDKVKFGKTLQGAHELIEHKARELGIMTFLVGNSSIKAHERISYPELRQRLLR